MGTGGETGGNAGASAACLNDWRGSSCDTCSSSSDDAGAGRTCRAVLDCYVERHCTGPTCANACDYNEPTSDEAVKLAQAVLACRCAVAP